MNNETASGAVEILLVEDNPGDVRLIQETLEAGRLGNRMHVVEDGVEAMAFLRREGAYADVPRPGLILLDLRLPKKDGLEVLGEIRTDGALKTIPVVMLTTSNAEIDIVKSYDLNVNAYVIKPVDLDQFINIVRSVEHFWLTVAELPPV